VRIARRGLFNYWNAFCPFVPPPRKVVQARVKAVGKKKEILELLMVFYFIYFNSEGDLIFDTFVTRTIKSDEWK
jgi:hypothetical protein